MERGHDLGHGVVLAAGYDDRDRCEHALGQRWLSITTRDGVGHAGSGEMVFRGIVDLHGHTERVGIRIYKPGEAGQGNDLRTKLSPLGGCDVAFLVPVHQGRALSAVVVEPEQHESGVVLGAVVALHLILVGQHLQMSAGMEKLLCLRGHAIVAQQVLKDVEVLGLVRPGILRALLEVGEGAPLSLLVADDGRVVGLGALVVAREGDVAVVVVGGLRLTAVPVEATCTTLDVILRSVVPGPSAAHVGAAVDAPWVGLLPVVHPVVTPLHPSTGGFVARAHHHKRGVVAIGLHHASCLVHEIGVDGLSGIELDAVVGP